MGKLDEAIAGQSDFPRVMPGLDNPLTVPQKIACAARILDAEGYALDVAGHITVVRDDADDGSMWCTPYGLWWGGITASDILVIDTTGRLQNKADLMAELQKLVRVIRKIDESAPHDCLLVLDATVGQNAHSQVETFRDMVDVTGLVMTKLDGSARGGVVVALAARFGLPVHAVGVGESLDDMRPFEARAFARSLLGLED